MPPTDNHTRMRPSLLDRLGDPQSFLTTGSTGFNMQKMKLSIQQDVTELLNTKQNVTDIDPDSELYTSILTFGLPDMITQTGNNEEQARSMARTVQNILTRFEPRLTRIKVTAVTGATNDPREVRFHIDAVLNIEPYRDVVGFETILELTTGRAKVTVEKT